MQEEQKFDFSKKVVTILDNNITHSTFKRKVAFGTFLAIGGVAIGIGIGIGNHISSLYASSQTERIRIAEIQTQNEELRKNKQFEAALKSKSLSYIAKAKAIEEETQKQTAMNELKEKNNMDLWKNSYNIWLKNKDDILANYEQQLKIYDVCYQNSVKAVNDGLMSVEDLTIIRNYYQDYKKNIHAYINLIQRSTLTFDIYRQLDKNEIDFLNEALTNYQNGSLQRSSELEKSFHLIWKDENPSTEQTRIAKNKMIADLAKMMNNNNSTTTTKKLKQ